MGIKPCWGIRCANCRGERAYLVIKILVLRVILIPLKELEYEESDTRGGFMEKLALMLNLIS